MSLTSFSDWHKKQRESKEWTQQEVAEKLGWDTGQYISNIERRISCLPKTKIKSVAKLYKVSNTFVALLVANDFKQELLEFVKH